MQHLVLIFAVLLTVLLSHIFFKKFNQTVSIIVFAMSVAFNFGFSEWMKSRSAADTEYAGYVVTRVEYYEDWDEWVEETCTDDNGIQHDCSYREYHEERWVMRDNSQYPYPIEHREYDDIVKYVEGKPVFKDLNRDYYTDDGDMYYVDIPLAQLIIPVTRTREYENRILPNQSLYHYEIISDKMKDSLGLFDYPEIVNYRPSRYPYPESVSAYQPATMGVEIADFIVKMDVVNALSGYQLRTFVFFYPDKGREIAQKQIDRLQLGNFNELIIMLGTKGDEIVWCETHSWEDTPTLSVAVKQWFTVNNSIAALMIFPEWYSQQIGAGLWTPKNPHDFDYIRTDFSLAQLGWICVAQIVFQIALFVYIFFFIRRLAKTRKKYENADDIPEEVQTITQKVMSGQKTTKTEQDILREHKRKSKMRDEELQLSRKRGAKAYTVMLVTYIFMILPYSFYMNSILSTVNFMTSIIVMPVAFMLCEIPVCIGKIIVIKKLGRVKS